MAVLALHASLVSFGQNLVPNHSFEEYDTCRVFNDVYYPDNGPIGWFSAGWTPDHFLSCLPYGSFNGVPLNAWSFQYPQDGECYAGVMTYREFPEGREYFMTQLIEPLVVGEEYYASFYASPEWGSAAPSPGHYLATSGIGMIFTTQPHQWELNDPIPEPLNYAHVYSQAIITDTVGWTLVSGSFVADSAYQYVMLGNAFDNANTDTLHFADQQSVPVGGMLIDNICVSHTPGGCPLAQSVSDHWMGAVVISPNPVEGELVVRGLDQDTQATIYAATGHQIWNGIVTAGLWRQNMMDHPPGMYYLRIGNKGLWRSLKFVLID